MKLIYKNKNIVSQIFFLYENIFDKKYQCLRGNKVNDRLSSDDFYYFAILRNKLPVFISNEMRMINKRITNMIFY